MNFFFELEKKKQGVKKVKVKKIKYRIPELNIV